MVRVWGLPSSYTYDCAEGGGMKGNIVLNHNYLKGQTFWWYSTGSRYVSEYISINITPSVIFTHYINIVEET